MDQQLTQKYNYWQWRTLIVLMISYALFYFVRKNFSIIMPALESELGISKIQLGIFLTINGVVYGVARFVNGFLADRYSRRLLMALGLGLSGVVNLALAFIPEMSGVFNLLDDGGKATMSLIYFVGGLLIINGYLQGLGYPPCASLMAHWIKPSELAAKQSIWNTSHSIGAGLVALLCGYILKTYSDSAWQWCFIIPGLLAIAGAFMTYFLLRDTPSSVGLPEIGAAEGKSEPAQLKGANFKVFLNKMVFGNPIIWILAAANFCVYVIRFTILDWGSMILSQYKGMDIQLAASVVAMAELAGGIIGMLVFGWVTDRFFKSKAHITCLLCTIAATISFFLFWRSGNATFSIVFVVLSAFFIYGPQALLGIACSNQATKHAAATANGILGIFGYISPLVAGAGFGFIAENSGWDAVFAVAVGFGILGSVILALLWKAPADGYAKAEKIIAEFDA